MATPIDECRRLIELATLTRGDFQSFLVQVRLVLESSNLKSDYPVLNRYCNWTLHAQLDSPSCLRVLKELTKVIDEAWDRGAPDDAMFLAITETLGVKRLRGDLWSFLDRFRLPTQIVLDDENWRGFFGMLASYVVDRPIRFPQTNRLNRRTRPIYDFVSGKSAHQPRGVKEFRFTWRTVADGKRELWWKMEMIVPDNATPNSVTLTGKFASKNAV